MDDPYAVDRRGFLKTGAVAAAATGVACGKPSSRWRALSEDEARTLGAACDQIIPPDQDPGASQAGVVSFIDRQLATRQKKMLPAWRRGIRALDAAARRLHGKPFADLESDRQTALLLQVEQGTGDKADWGDLDPGDFFRLLHGHTMMGFYGDPRHGGNKDRVAWKMIGVPDPPVRGRLHETPPPPALAPRAAAPQPAGAGTATASRKG
jgi:gluconate 2-dehydrogenase gamma chain